MGVSFFGWYGRDNCGDEAFKEVHRHILPGMALEWLCERGPADETAGTAQKYVLGAGDVFMDYYLQWIPDGAKFIVYGAGLGWQREVDRVVSNQHRIQAIWLRNREDVAKLNALGIAAHYTPDIVFNLHDVTQTWAPAPPRKVKRMYVILSNNLHQDAHRRNSIRLLSYLTYFKHELADALGTLAEYYEVVLLPFSMDANDFDPSFCADVYSLASQFGRSHNGTPAVRMITTAPAPWDVLRLLHDADLVLSMKFHGLIFATLLGVPFVNIGLSRKNRLFCAENGLDDLSMEEFSLTRRKLEAHVKIAEDPRTRPRLQALAAELAQQAGGAAAEFLEALLA